MADYNGAVDTQDDSIASTLSPEQARATFHFKKIGPVKNAEMELGDLTVIAGHNNTGKTYIAYTLYGFLRSFSESVGPFLDATDVLPFAGKMIGWAEKLNGFWPVYDPNCYVRSSETKDNPPLMRWPAYFPKECYLKCSVRRRLSEEHRLMCNLESGRRESTSHRDNDLQSGAVLSYGYDGEELKISIDKTGSTVRFFEILSPLSRLYLQFLLPDIPFNPFVLSAERFGISLFYRELDFTRNNLVDALQKMADDRSRAHSYPLFIDSTTSRYALPIKHNIDYTRSIPDLKDRSGVYDDKLYDYIKDMLSGYYSTSDGGIRFVSKARRGDRKFNIPLHLASTSARGLSDFYFFLRYVAEKGQLLIIDEPESHLDTSNQILMARLLARCIKAGLKVLITTHSDYLVKEINNLIMLSGSFPDKESLVKSLGYESYDSISPSAVRAYVAEGNSLARCNVDEYGIEMPVFDDTIDSINRIANELTSRLQENES